MSARPRSIVLVMGLLCGALIGLAAGARAAGDYHYETDPVRLGMKSVEVGNLIDAKAMFDEAIQNAYRVEEAHRGIGEVYLLQGLYPEATAEFQKALGGPKKVPEACAGIGLVALREGRSAEAEAAFNAAIAEDDGLWRAKYGLARIALQKNDLDRAAELLKSGSKKKGVGDGEHLYRLGMTLLLVAQGKPDEAESHALTALNLAPTDPDVVLAVGDVYEKKGVADLAIAKFEAILADSSVVVNKGQLHYRLALQYEKKQKYNDAMKNYLAAVRADSSLADAFLHAGAILAAADKYEEATQWYFEYTKLRPKDASGLRRFAEVCIETNRFGPALVAAKAAVALDSTNVESRLALARAASAMKETETALDTYRALPEEKYDGRDHMNLGNVLLQMKENDEARTHFQTAVTMDTTLADAYFGLGYLDLLEKDYAASEENLLTAARLSPSSAAAVLNLGIVELQLSKFEQATAAFRKAAELAPKSPQPRVYLGQSYAIRDSMRAAEAAYKEALAIDAENAGALKGYAFVLLSAEPPRCGEAEELLVRATKSNPNDAGTWVYLGQALACLGKTVEARSAFERALAIDPNNKLAKDGLRSLGGGGAGAR